MKKNLLKLIVLLIFLGGVVAAGSYSFLSQRSQDPAVETVSELFGWKYPVTKFPSTGLDDKLVAYSDIRDPGGIPQGLPVRLKIPIIGVNSAIEDALITPDGRMDVPAGSKNVAWFSLGPHPGKEGSAVIGGHFGISNGVPFVFYKLDKLKVGDEVHIVDDKGDTLVFVVRSISLFDRDADATTVFTSNDGLAHLNLITCEGIWNRVDDTYPDRRVVFTDLISVNGVPAAAQPIATFSRTLSIGMRGWDVGTLQTLLEQKGFLTIPDGAAQGFFGTLTSTAVSQYQASVGLTPTGVFDELTIAQMLSEYDKTATITTTLPLTSIWPIESASLGTLLIQAVKSLYATPIDGFITSFLIISIGFLSFRIIRRRF